MRVKGTSWAITSLIHPLSVSDLRLTSETSSGICSQALICFLLRSESSLLSNFSSSANIFILLISLCILCDCKCTPPPLHYPRMLKLDYNPYVGRHKAENENLSAIWFYGIVVFGNYFFIFLFTVTNVGDICLFYCFGPRYPVTDYTGSS